MRKSPYVVFFGLGAVLALLITLLFSPSYDGVPDLQGSRVQPAAVKGDVEEHLATAASRTQILANREVRQDELLDLPSRIENSNTPTGISPPPDADRLELATTTSRGSALPTSTSTEVPGAPTDSETVPTCWNLSTNLPENYYAIDREREDVVSGTSSVHYHSTSGLAQHGSLVQTINAASLAGGRIEFSAFTKTEALTAGVSLWLTAIDGQGRFVASHHLDWIKDAIGWGRRALVIDVPNSAAAIIFGFSMLGQGTLWVDGAQLVRVGLNIPATSPTTQVGGFFSPPQLSSLPPTPRNLDFESWGDSCT